MAICKSQQPSSKRATIYPQDRLTLIFNDRTSEAMGQGHWWDTVFHDKTVQQFLDQHTSPRQEKKELNEFCITLMNPAGNGSVCGIHVEQMMIPYRLGKIKGVFSTTDNSSSSKKTLLLTLKTTNIASFRFTRHFKGCNKLIVDGDKFSHLEKHHTVEGGVTLSFDGKKSKRWKVSLSVYTIEFG